MIWLLAIPFVFFFTFQDLIQSNFPHTWNNNPRSFLDWCFLIFVGCFISCLISAVSVIVASIIGSIPKRQGIKDKEYLLVALREKDGFKGRSYFLGAGFIEDKQYYFWYRKHSDGSIRGGKTSRNSSVRVYEVDAEPKMVTFKTEYINKRQEKYFWIFGIDFRDDESWSPDFYIPKGSIKEGYML